MGNMVLCMRYCNSSPACCSWCMFPMHVHKHHSPHTCVIKSS